MIMGLVRKKRLIIFDITCLNSSELSYVIHDSVMFSEISFGGISDILISILGFLNKFFLAIDGIGKYSIDIQ